MGWDYRRSLNLGPLRLNLSKSGVGYSVGAGGIRIGQDSRGRKCRSLSSPGTGIVNKSYLASAGAKRPAGAPHVQQNMNASVVQQLNWRTPALTRNRWLFCIASGLALYVLVRAIF